jgi:UDP-GlcNAc:undecaprenyl-phosphate GlcNAc-1-phosphate transferase
MTGAGWHSGAVAFACALASAPAVAAICRRWTLYDFPGPLKIHKKPIPRLGGAGIAIALVLSIVIECHAPRNVILWLAAFGVIWLAGLLDDIRGLSPFLRLAAQICSGILLWSAGWSLPLGVPALLNIAAICGIVVVFVNAFNFLDGSDGLAAGVTAVIAGAYILAFGVHPDRLGLVVAWAVLGACLGFLERNLPPATVFMGDSGSTILGFCVAFLGIDFISRVPVQPDGLKWLFPLLVAALPLVDGAVVVFRRLKRGHSPFLGDRRHYYDRWLARGWSPRKIALGSYAITGLLGAVALWTTKSRLGPVAILLCAVAAGISLASIDRIPFRAQGQGSNRAPVNS